MPGWGTTNSRADAASSRDAAGVVRIPGEEEPLRVTITVSDSTVVMRADALELGSWPTADVKISRIDPWSFAFLAEGDRLVFVPDDARSFATNPLVRASVGSETKAKTKRTIKIPRLRLKEQSEEPVRSQPIVKRTQPPKPNPKPEAKAKAKQPRVKRREPTSQSASESDSDTTREPVWLRAVDAARENGLFGLDRVPVSMHLRDQAHQHTYDHGASSATGLGNRICTICGKVRIRR